MRGQTEILSTVILTSIVLAIGSALFYLVLTWSSDYSYRTRLLGLIESTGYDFDIRIETVYRDGTGVHMFLHIIRIGSLDLVGVSPLVSIETTDTVLSEPDRIWYTDYEVVSPDNISYSQPIEPSRVSPGVLNYTTCSSGSAVSIPLSSLYVRGLSDWVSLKDLRRGQPISSMSLCRLPLPPAPLGQIVLQATVPSSLAKRYIVVSLWVMTGDRAYNIRNILYPYIT